MAGSHIFLFQGLKLMLFRFFYIKFVLVYHLPFFFRIVFLFESMQHVHNAVSPDTQKQDYITCGQYKLI